MSNASFKMPDRIAKRLSLLDFLEAPSKFATNKQIVEESIHLLCITVAGFLNILAFAVLIRRRLWIQHEGYIHLLAILVGKILIVTTIEIPEWISFFGRSYHIQYTSDVFCKFWNFLQHVKISTSLFLVGLLLDVYLRFHLAQGARLKSLASYYCTVGGSLVVVGVFSGVFTVMNVWRLLYFSHSTFTYFDRTFRQCSVMYELMVSFNQWELVFKSVLLYVPIAVVIPILSTMILCARRKQSATIVPIPASDDSVEVLSSSSNYEDFTKASVFIAAAVFISQFPTACYELLLKFLNTESTYFISIKLYELAFPMELISRAHLIVVPILCLTVITNMRQQLKSSMCDRCCKGITCCREVEENENISLPLDAIQNRSISDVRDG